MSCNAQWSVVCLRQRHSKRPSGTRAKLRFLSNRRWLKTKDFHKLLVTVFSPALQSHDLSFTEMHGETVGGVSCFVQQMHTNIVGML